MEKATSTSLFFLCVFLVFLAFCSIPGAKSQELGKAVLLWGSEHPSICPGHGFGSDLLIVYVDLGAPEDEEEFSYEAGSENGPEHWGDLNPEWSLCKNGTMQSPIDLTHKRVEVAPGLGRLKRSYKPATAAVKNRGHDIMLKWIGDAGSIHIDGVEYHLRQCHWHSPSEHSINGRRFEMEVHLVHQSRENKTAVLGIMYKRGRPDPFLSELMEPIEDIARTKDEETEVGVANPWHIKLGSRKYYRYLGSLTTPPCHQNVLWTITRKVLLTLRTAYVRTVSMEQVRMLREAVHDDAEKNARPLQEINKREIRFYRPQTLDGRPRR
ncbi:hypothetical protein Taro_047645 [Colocasia esculenta]|uniref:Carbonic anhydrase n=1 Tax=Colocasia esculenta TaxID=4460 RepID=A0A843X7Z5_COLES|nr:hypothetical protein [Colocasia esculenta]